LFEVADAEYILSEGYALLGRSNRQMLRMQKKSYKQLYKKLPKKDINKKKKILFLIFKINPQLYYYILKFYKSIKREK